jgi:hypothetical protein
LDGGGALAIALAQEAEFGVPLIGFWNALERLRASEARSINRAEILTALKGAVAEAAEVAAAEAAAAFRTVQFINLHQSTATFRDHRVHVLK